MAKLPARPSLAFLASHNGTNMRAIVAACKSGALRAQPLLVVSNNGDASALDRETRLLWSRLRSARW